MKKTIKLGIILLFAILTLYYGCNHRRVRDSDFNTVWDIDTIAVPKLKSKTIPLQTPDTTKYKGNWIDVN